MATTGSKRPATIDSEKISLSTQGKMNKSAAPDDCCVASIHVRTYLRSNVTVIEF
jgi:hypothetical protein